MEKVERSFIEPIREVDFDKAKLKFDNPFINMQSKLEMLFLKKGYILLLIGFLLGRALILAKLTPFSIPFFAAVYLIRRDRAPLALVGLVAGAATLSIRDAVSTFALTVLYLIVYRVSKKWLKNEVKIIPFFVLSIILLGNLAEGYFYSQTIVLYDLIMAGVEAGLGFILTLIFLQSLPLLSITKRRQSLKTEEIVCLIILLASVMTGTIGWTIYDLSIEHIFSRYLVILFAFVAGATVGSTVGVVTGLIFSLANVSSFFHMSLLAFAGLLGGLLKEGNKIGAAIGLFIATLLLGMYGDGSADIVKTISETTAATLLFFLTPYSLTSKLAKYIPGTADILRNSKYI